MEKKRADIITEQIEEMIFDGTFENGDRLDEISLSAQFGVSRTPLREAFQRLSVSGLVEQIPRRGVFVRQPGPVELIEMFEVMAELEAACARFAAIRISETALAELGAINNRCAAAVEAQDANGYYAENERFHATLYQQSGNSVLEQECLRLQKRLKPFRRVQLRLRGRLKQSLEEHHKIVEALIDADGTRASDVARSHVAVQGEKFHHLLSSLKPAAE